MQTRVWLLLMMLIHPVAWGAGDYSPYVESVTPDTLLFGDTHLHTAYSVDAALTGNELTPEQALRFARGERVISSRGLAARLLAPLDFLVLTDHSENLGLASLLSREDAEVMASSLGRELVRLVQAGELTRAMGVYDSKVISGINPLPLKQNTRTSIWSEITAAAEKYNTPGVFSAMIGFEWTSSPGGDNLHRNVIYRDGKQRADSLLPFTAFNSEDPEQLWDWMDRYEQLTGGKVLAIPHNGNLSNGRMFEEVRYSGRAFDTDYSRRRRQREPLYEVTQIKGDGETHPMLSPADQFADFETWDIGSLASVPKQPGMIKNEYAREALKNGLRYETSLGENPFQFGMIGSTDAHTGLSTAREENFFGKLSVQEPAATPARFDQVLIGYMLGAGEDGITLRHRQASASGLAAVWATENSREAIWDAMQRREVYATTGTRIQVRIFAGWEFEQADIERPRFQARGYLHGVPMGGVLESAEGGRSPGFLVHAARDPGGANLDRVQMVKGWITPTGETRERVYDIAWADERKLDAQGTLPPVGSSVDMENASYSNTIGSPILSAFWEDPDFDPRAPALYYLRVLEIPTPRWTTHDAAFFELERPAGVPEAIQERAYTSPIWYRPGQDKEQDQDN